MQEKATKSKVVTRPKDRPSYMGIIRSLSPGEKTTFPIEKTNTIRAEVGIVGAMLERRFSTHVLREECIIEVTRIK